jgi:hypothetical protein
VNRPPVTLPRARLVVDGDGHLTVTVDGQPWWPSTDDQGAPGRSGGLSLGRSDVLWARRQIANELGTPVLVEVIDGGRTYSDVVDPGGYETLDPSSPIDRAATATPSDQELRGEGAVGAYEVRYAPGEPVVIAAVVARVRADEHGLVHFRLPAALSDRTLLVHGQASGTTLPFEQRSRPGQPADPTDAAEASDSADAPAPVRAQAVGHNADRRRRPGPGPAPVSSRPALTAPDAPDAGLGAL